LHDERENKTSLLKYEVCALLMVNSIQNNSVRIKQVGYGSITVNKLLVWFANHLNGFVNFNSVRFVVSFAHPC